MSADWLGTCPVAEVACGSACGGSPRPPFAQLVPLGPEFTGPAYYVHVPPLELRICQIPSAQTLLVNRCLVGADDSRLEHCRGATAADTDRHTCSAHTTLILAPYLHL